MELTIAAALAVAAALAEFAVVPYVQIGDAVLQPVLVFGTVWTVVVGFEAGLTWAFIGGLTLDVLSQRPLGASAFSLLIAVGAATLIGAALRQARLFAPVVATAAASLIYSVLLLFLTSLLNGHASPDGASGMVIPSAVYGTIVAAAVGPLAVAIMARRRDAERVDW